jgi:hypothetical protein
MALFILAEFSALPTNLSKAPLKGVFSEVFKTRAEELKNPPTLSNSAKDSQASYSSRSNLITQSNLELPCTISNLDSQYMTSSTPFNPVFL